ncbi:MAG: hypothetical protein HY673_06275 [Chloroflexi bacterium]|nr:hypothetical protein [Chloroflexota bacterium]
MNGQDARSTGLRNGKTMRLLPAILALAIITGGCADVVSPLPAVPAAAPTEEAASPVLSVPDEATGGAGLPESPAGLAVVPGTALSPDVLAPNLPATAPMPSPEPAAVPPPARTAELWPDLVPHADESRGWGAPVVLGTAGEIGAPGVGNGLFIGFGIENAGEYEAFDVISRLFVNSQEAWVFPVARLASRESAFGYVAVDDIASRLLLYPGSYRLELALDNDNFVDELDKSNNSYSVDMVVARAPVARRAPQSAVETQMQRLLDENTWVSGQNIAGVMAVAKEVLADVPIDYSRVKVTVLPFEVFNARYGDALGKNALEKTRLAENAASYPQVGLGYVRGTAAVQEVVIREGLLNQVLTVLFRELGGAFYQQYNARGKVLGSASEANELAVTLFEAYAMRLLQEKYGWGGVANVSYRVDRRPIVAALWDGGPLGRYVRRAWALAVNFGSDGRNYVSSRQLYAWYLNLINMRDPTVFVRSLDQAAADMDRNAIARNVAWRGLVDKDPSPLPDPVRKAVDPRGTIGPALTEDYLLVFQTHFVYP